MTDSATTRPWDPKTKHLLRELAPQVLGVVARRFRDFSAPEDAVQESKVPFRLPTPVERTERLPAVIRVLYLIFSEGYASSISAQLQRLDLAREGIRLTRARRLCCPRMQRSPACYR